MLAAQVEGIGIAHEPTSIIKAAMQYSRPPMVRHPDMPEGYGQPVCYPVGEDDA